MTTPPYPFPVSVSPYSGEPFSTRTYEVSQNTFAPLPQEVDTWNTTAECMLMMQNASRDAYHRSLLRRDPNALQYSIYFHSVAVGSNPTTSCAFLSSPQTKQTLWNQTNGKVAVQNMLRNYHHNRKYNLHLPQ